MSCLYFRTHLILVGVMITLIGCVKSDDLPSLKLEPSTPHLAFPLLHAQVTTDDLVAEVEGRTAISINEEGVFQIARLFGRNG